MERTGQEGREREQRRSRPFRMRTVSPISSALLASAAVVLALSAVGFAIGQLAIDWGIVFKGVARGTQPYLCDGRGFPAGIALLIAAFASESVSRLRVPPPAWRVKQELSKTLIDMGLLPSDTAKWKGVYWVAPLGSYSFKERRYSLLFDVRHARATEERFAKLDDSAMSSFSHSQGVSVEPARVGNRRGCWRLVVRYAPNPYGKVESPW